MNYKIDNVERILRDKDFDIFVHGCNAQGKFRSGIAGIVRKVYPKAAEVYEDKVSHQKQGQVNWYWPTPNQVIINAITQNNYGYTGAKFASYDAVDECFKWIASYVKGETNSKKIRIYYPLIGCGLGGLQWSIVKEIIDYRLKGLDHYCIVRIEDVIKYNLLDAVDQLWKGLSDIPTEDIEIEGQYSHSITDEEFLHFSSGTDVDDIWHWFEETFNISVGQRYF